jgi:acetyltransferase-like isoleucine patch superfamily enzyme
VRELVKLAAHGAATLLVLPSLISFAIRRTMMGSNRALEGSSQMLAGVPGVIGDYMRRAFLGQVLKFVDRSATIQFGTLFSQCGARLDENVYVGPRCHLGLVHLEKDVLLAAGVHIPSGAATHGTDDTTVPIREQTGSRTLVRVGEGTWVGSAAVILADVGKHCVVAAGAVVTKPLPDFVVAAGVPARVIRDRRAPAAE